MNIICRDICWYGYVKSRHTLTYQILATHLCHLTGETWLIQRQLFDNFDSTWLKQRRSTDKCSQTSSTFDSADLSSFKAGMSASEMAAWGRRWLSELQSQVLKYVKSNFLQGCIPDVATTTRPSCWDESSSLQTTVRGRGIDFDILQITMDSKMQWFVSLEKTY